MKVFEFVSRKIFTQKAETENSFSSQKPVSHGKQDFYYDNFAYGQSTNKMVESSANNHCHETESEPKKVN